MINNFNMFNNRYFCSPLLAATPFTGRFTAPRITRGEVGLSGPNIELIAFNSGDILIEGVSPTAIIYAVGLGFAMIINDSNDIALSQLGVPMSRVGTLNNFEIGFSVGSNASSSVTIEYFLIIIRSLNNTGNDYTVPMSEIIFTGTENNLPISAGDKSSNMLITTPEPLSNPNVNIGDRVVLMVNFFTSFISPGSVKVSASIQLTPLPI